MSDASPAADRLPEPVGSEFHRAGDDAPAAPAPMAPGGPGRLDVPVSLAPNAEILPAPDGLRPEPPVAAPAPAAPLALAPVSEAPDPVPAPAAEAPIPVEPPGHVVVPRLDRLPETAPGLRADHGTATVALKDGDATGLQEGEGPMSGTADPEGAGDSTVSTPAAPTSEATAARTATAPPQFRPGTAGDRAEGVALRDPASGSTTRPAFSGNAGDSTPLPPGAPRPAPDLRLPPDLSVLAGPAPPPGPSAAPSPLPAPAAGGADPRPDLSDLRPSAGD